MKAKVIKVEGSFEPDYLAIQITGELIKSTEKGHKGVLLKLSTFEYKNSLPDIAIFLKIIELKINNSD